MSGVVLVFAFFLAYFLPSLIGFARDKANGMAIFALNLLLGWTFIGWVMALVWAVSTQVVDAKGPAAASVPYRSEPTCTTCGALRRATDRFCSQCGAPG